MPRSMWKGAISFGLVTIPVAVYPATEEKTLRFNQLHDEDMGRIRYKRDVREGRRDRRLRAHRQGVRVREGPLRRAHRRGLRQGAGRIQPRDRHPAVRRPRRDRPHDVQEVLLPDPRGDRRQGLRAAPRGDEPGQQGGHRQGQLPRQGAPGGAAVLKATRSCWRRCTGPTRCARPTSVASRSITRSGRRSSRWRAS